MKSLTLNFQNTQFDIVDLNGQKWLRGSQIGEALGYADPRMSIAKLYERNSDEFTSSMTGLVKLPDLRSQSDNAGTDFSPQIEATGQTREVRIFSLRGAHLLGMLANTEPAKEFRRWILDVLENGSNPQLITTVQNHLLANNPKLGLALLYRQQNLSIEHIAELLRTTTRRVTHYLSTLEVCGLLPCLSPHEQIELF
jgi:prophage antirepressor-like protein